jgi:7-cyano-7-deazaguanine tRNA-ribosyltransferase
MKFFISWSRSDAVFTEYFKDCNVLISPHTTTLDFHIGMWNNQPTELIIDSSAFFYIANNSDIPPQKDIFKRQVKVLDGAKCKVLMTHLDRPINNKLFNSIDVYNAIEKTLGNAYEFLDLINSNKLSEKFDLEPMGVIQGNDKLSLQFCANELKKIGFKKFGIGSLAPLFSPKEIVKRIQWVCEIVGGENLHVFGISRLDIIEELNRLNIMSLDSTRPIKSAIFNGIFYSEPFRTYGIKNAQNASSYGNRLLEKPLPCKCPVCNVNPFSLIETGNKKATNARAIHNYYHLLEHLSQ